MTNMIEIAPGQTLTNQELQAAFFCGNSGGMRRSHATNSLVLVSDHLKSLYDDRWIGNVLHYTGMGQSGDQSLDFMQNKTLSESDINGVDIYLFEVVRENQYTFVDRVRLDGKPYQEQQPGADGKDRLVWVFPLLPIGGAPLAFDRSVLLDLQERKLRQAKRLTDEELKKRASRAPAKPGGRLVNSYQHERSIWVAEYAKRRSNGVCDLCNKPAPFETEKGPYLECHHIVWLSNGGEDSIENTVALCPNCHRKMHLKGHAKDINSLRALNANRD